MSNYILKLKKYRFKRLYKKKLKIKFKIILKKINIGSNFKFLKFLDIYGKKIYSLKKLSKLKRKVSNNLKNFIYN